jgi:hypothetical protein
MDEITEQYFRNYDIAYLLLQWSLNIGRQEIKLLCLIIFYELFFFTYYYDLCPCLIKGAIFS